MMEIISENRSHGGRQLVVKHASEATSTDMTFSIYLPPQAQNGACPVLWYLSGLTCTHANGGTVGFGFDSTAEVDAWHAAGCAAGGKSCEDPPGYRENAFGKLYLAYLRDPDGNKLCALYRMPG